MRRLSLSVLEPIGLVMASVAAAALWAGLVQTGGVSFHAASIGFCFHRVNPLTNLKGLFSLRGLARLGKSMVPVAVLAIFAVQRIARQLTIPPFSTSRLESLGSDVFGLLEAAAGLLFGWAVIDYAVEWQSRESRLKMSKQEMREEMKETEGSPQIRSRIRGLQRQMRRRKVKADVSKAAVVLVNPTHYAVALGFDFATMDAPKVLAKGRNLLAEEIKSEARWAGVPIVENPPWRVRFIARSRWGSPFRWISMPWSRPFSPICTGSGWRRKCASAGPGRLRRGSAAASRRPVVPPRPSAERPAMESRCCCMTFDQRALRPMSNLPTNFSNANDPEWEHEDTGRWAAAGLGVWPPCWVIFQKRISPAASDKFRSICWGQVPTNRAGPSMKIPFASSPYRSAQGAFCSLFWCVRMLPIKPGSRSSPANGAGGLRHWRDCMKCRCWSGPSRIWRPWPAGGKSPKGGPDAIERLKATAWWRIWYYHERCE